MKISDSSNQEFNVKFVKFVNTLTGKHITLKAEEIPLDQQRLIFAELLLVLRLRGGF
jgi:hypothetical protein